MDSQQTNPVATHIHNLLTLDLTVGKNTFGLISIL